VFYFYTDLILHCIQLKAKSTTSISVKITPLAFLQYTVQFLMKYSLVYITISKTPGQIIIVSPVD